MPDDKNPIEGSPVATISIARKFQGDYMLIVATCKPNLFEPEGYHWQYKTIAAKEWLDCGRSEHVTHIEFDIDQVKQGYMVRCILDSPGGLRVPTQEILV